MGWKKITPELHRATCIERTLSWVVTAMAGSAQLKPRVIWELRLRTKGEYQEFRERIRERVADLPQGPSRLAAQRDIAHEELVRTGYSPRAARAWWWGWIRACAAEERQVWMNYIDRLLDRELLMESIEKGTCPGQTWRRDDLPDDVAWVASRPCLLSERQSQKDENGALPPITPEDFAGCPSVQARNLLDWAYVNRDKFMAKLLDVQLTQWGKKKPEPSEATKSVASEKKAGDAAEVAKGMDAAPKELQQSDVASLIERMLKGG